MMKAYTNLGCEKKVSQRQQIEEKYTMKNICFMILF